MAESDEIISTDPQERESAERWAQEDGRPPEQICNHAVNEFNELASVKFWQGQKEHGGCLDDRDCIAESKKEILDLWFYICSAEWEIKRLRESEKTAHKQMLFYKELSKR